MLQQRFPLDGLSSQPHGLLIGRLETCQIRFPPDARMIGREHACLVIRPDGVFLVGLHQNGTFVDGAVVGQGGQVELHYGARIQLGKGGPILVLRELAEIPAPPRAAFSGGRTIIEPRQESVQDLRAEIDALKTANQELDRQNQELRAEKESLKMQLQKLQQRAATPAPTPPPSVQTPAHNTAEAQSTFLRFSQGLLQLQKSATGEHPNQDELQGKIELLIFDLDDLHRVVTGT